MKEVDDSKAETLRPDHPTTQTRRKHYLSMANSMDNIDTELERQIAQL
jgi:hypothetical protein